MKTRLTILALLFLAGCNAGPDPTFVVAARLNYDAIVPEWLGYVDADPKLTAEQRERRHLTARLADESIKVREAKK